MLAHSLTALSPALPAKEGTSPLSSSAPAGSDVDMADSSKGSTRKPRAASQKRPVTRDDASTDSEEEDASPKPVKKKASDKVDKAGMLYCHQGRSFLHTSSSS